MHQTRHTWKRTFIINESKWLWDSTRINLMVLMIFIPPLNHEWHPAYRFQSNNNLPIIALRSNCENTLGWYFLLKDVKIAGFIMWCYQTEWWCERGLFSEWSESSHGVSLPSLQLLHFPLRCWSKITLKSFVYSPIKMIHLSDPTCSLFGERLE